MSRLSLFLLGPPRLERDGKPLELQYRKNLALVAYLAVTGQSHTREALITLLWPELEPSRGRAGLRRNLSVLRRALGGPWLVTDRETVGLEPSADAQLWSDVDQFRRLLTTAGEHDHPQGQLCAECATALAEAVDSYRGDFLAGFSLRDSVNFDEWQFFQTESLRGELASALERLTHDQGIQGQYEAAIPYARRWLALDPLHEPVHRHLMQLYAQAGQHAAALRQYRECVRLLEEELDLAPSDETTALYERIRAERAHPAAAEVTAPPRPLFHTPLPASLRPARDAMLGREEELGAPPEAETTALFQAIKAGRETPPSKRFVAERPRHNLPPQPTPFIGREEELADLDKLITDPNVRLITIVGPGGMGKTRLALAAAERYLADTDETHPFPDGAFFVDLASLSDADQIIPTLADTFNIQLQGGEEEASAPEKQILGYLRQTQMLLILDNFEHLLDGVDLLAAILQTAPDVLILATSRERLHLHEEQVYAIQGLDYSDWETPTEPDLSSSKDITEYTAARLFIQRARRVQHNFELQADDVDALTRICRLVEGMPLGLELAAAWVDMLSLADIAAEIADQVGRSFDFLETELRDVPERHRNMRAVIDVSWRQLSEAEREVFPKLSVFRGGFTRQAAQEVIATASLRLLARLVNKSLLQYDRAQDRYAIHELLRRYGAEKLTERTSDVSKVHDQHSAYYCAALQQWEIDLKGARQFEALDEIKTDIENVRAAWRWATDHKHVARLDQAMDGLCLFYDRPFSPGAGQAACLPVVDMFAGDETTLSADAVRVLAKALAWQAFFQGRGGELCNPLLEQRLDLLNSPALADQDTRREKAFLLRVMGYAEGSEIVKPDREQGRRLIEESVSLYGTLGDQWEAAHSAVILANITAALQPDHETRQMYEESLASFRALGDQWMVARTLNLLGSFEGGTGNLDLAQQLYEESLALSQAQGNRAGSVYSLRSLSALANIRGEFEAAKGYARQVTGLCRDTGNQYELGLGLMVSAAAFQWSGQFVEAHTILEEAIAESKEFQLPTFMAWIAYQQGAIKTYVGRYDKARVQVESTLAMARDKDYRRLTANCQETLACVMLGEEQHGEAQQLLLKCVTARRAERLDEDQVAGSLALLGRAVYGLGNRAEAQGYLLEALEMVIELGAFVSLMRLMPIIPVLLADEEDDALKERAVELYALAESQPFVANSQLFKDIAGKHIAAAAATLAPEVVKAAQSRGRTLDWRDTAATLLDELRELGWAD